MTSWIRKSTRLLLFIVAGVLFMALLYGSATVVLSIIPVNGALLSEEEPSVDIYFISNGVHFDIILPAQNKYKDWYEDILPDCRGELVMKFVGFGWGDKGFYLSTPTWADLKFSTAFKALFLRSESAIHVCFYSDVSGSDSMKRLRINTLQYRKLVQFIVSSFRRNRYGKTIRITGLSYSDQDCFYEANRSYSLFYTCNTWANQALKKSGLRACLWTPFDRGIIYQYKSLFSTQKRYKD